MVQERDGNRIFAVVFLLLFIIGYLLINVPKSNETVYFSNYIVDSICLIVSIMLIMRLYVWYKLDLFEPITVIGSIYIIEYFFTPIYDLIVGEYEWYGYDLFPYGIKSTLIAFIGFLIFYFCYTHTFVIRNNGQERYMSDKYLPENRSTLVFISLCIYTLALAANIYYITRVSGNSILYTLTLGILGDGNTVVKTEASIGFISMFSYSLPAATLLYWEYGNGKILKGVLFVVMFMLQVARGFRFFIIAIAITFFSYYYLKKGTRPKVRTIIMLFLIIIVPIILMTVFRNSIRSGNGMDLSLLNSERIKKSLDEAIWDNFRIYKNFYAMTDKIPSKYPFVYGRQMIIGTLIMFIPRAIWPGKVSTQAGVGLEYIVGSSLRGTGQAYPNIGEYYYAFGTWGVIIFMGIYGIWARRTKMRHFYKKDALDIILYSVLLGNNLQLLIRGYTPSNFWYLVFSILPVAVIKLFIKKERRNTFE